MLKSAFSVAAMAITAEIWAGPVVAQQAGDFYKDKQVRLIIANAAGGDSDLAGRLLARHMNRHIPGHPTIVVQNMPGAGTILAANHLYNVAPKDGLVFGTFSRNLPSQAVLGRDNIKFDPRLFGWVGGIGLPSRFCVALSTSKIKSADDLFTQELLVGGSGAGHSDVTKSSAACAGSADRRERDPLAIGCARRYGMSRRHKYCRMNRPPAHAVR